MVQTTRRLALTSGAFSNQDQHKILIVSNFEKFPDSLRFSAVARWSHRDPIEQGNPFSQKDSRHRMWHTATAYAEKALVRSDGEFEHTLRNKPEPYPTCVVILAVSRFDVWSRRALSIVRSYPALLDYEQWLAMYVKHWLKYVKDTCPKIDVNDIMGTQLTARAKHWAGAARRRTLSGT